MAQKIRGGQPKFRGGLTAASYTPKQVQPKPNLNSVAQQQSPVNPLASSYEKMGIGKIGDLSGRMGELEKASMRLGEAASQRRIGEIGSEYDSRRKLQEAQADIEARQLGYKGLPAMQRYLEDKRREEELLSKKALSSEGGWLRRV
jgi:hypothetical protein